MKNIVVILLLFFALTTNCDKKNFNSKEIAKTLTEEQTQNIFQSIETDKPTKKRSLMARHYPSSNERRIDFFMPYIKNLKGGYIGVGTDQNFSFIAWAKSDFAWLVDFDAVSVAVNKIHIYFISISPTFKDFKKLWRRSRRKKSRKLLKKHFKPKIKNKKNMMEYKTILKAWSIAHRGKLDVPSRLKDLDYMIKHFKLSTFVNNKEDYDYIRKMVLHKRIIAIPGDLTKTKTIQSIAQSAKLLKIPIRVFYMSNAEEYFRFPKNFRNNILALPIDDKGYIVRTSSRSSGRFGYPKGEKFIKYPLHYSLQRLQNMKIWMKFKAKFKITTMLKYRTTIEKGFSIIEATPLEAGLKENKK